MDFLFYRPTIGGKEKMSVSVEYIESFWDCPECGQQAISAIDGGMLKDGFTCPNCAYNRKRNDELYERPESRLITDQSLIDQIESGKIDWECKYCQALNPQTGIGEDMMACRVCGQFQQDEISPEAPLLDQTGEIIEKRTEEIRDRLEVIPENLQQHVKPAANDNSSPFSIQLPDFDWQSLPWRPIVKGASIACGLVAVGSGLLWLFAPRPVEVKVQSLPWEVTVEVQQLVPVNKSGWDETVPFGARVRSSETRQRGTQEVQRGTKTIMETEEYRSGTKTESYTETERYQSGTKTESYTDSERYQSGTTQNCTSTSTGKGAVRRSCSTSPVYSTRSVPRTRQVPQYSTRLVPKTRTVPVYSTRQVPRTVPNMVTEPVFDTYVNYTVDEWHHKQTLTSSGFDNQPRVAPKVTLDNSRYPQRALTPQESCHVTGAYRQGDEQKVQTWGIPCNQFDRLNTGDTVTLEVNRVGGATLKLPE